MWARKARTAEWVLCGGGLSEISKQYFRIPYKNGREKQGRLSGCLVGADCRRKTTKNFDVGLDVAGRPPAKKPQKSCREAAGERSRAKVS